MLIWKKIAFFSQFSQIKTLRNYQKMEATKPFKKPFIRETIELTSNEKDLFTLFKDFVHEENLKTTLRVAGGWVRDKVP